MSIPFIDLKSQYSRIESRVKDGLDRVLAHGAYVMGPEIAELEKELAAFCGAKHALACSSGTDALLLALMAKNTGPGDAVLTTPFTFCATAEVIALLGATPVFVDIDPDTFNIDPDSLKLAIQALRSGDPDVYPLPSQAKAAEYPGKGPHARLIPKGLISVDLFGLPCDYDAINPILEEEGLWLLVDAAQSFGSLYKGISPCTLGDTACTSFFPAKPLGCYGDGGMCFTNDTRLHQVLESLRVHGQGKNRYDNVRLGLNARMDTMQAAVLLAKMSIFPGEIELRNSVARTYNNLLQEARDITVPSFLQDRQSAWAQYSLLARDHEHRQAVFDSLKKNDVPWSVYYPLPLHLQDVFSYLGYSSGAFPVSEEMSERIFSLPMHPYLDRKDQGKVARAVIEGSRR
ncbi:DegT/DnrJ/EryC1/StrS family aminotransferase [Desulfonatronospira sp.]|uniref:DegT/DnrJ/EryC1/StrS family aminotransferase n=1 Tax=Desulfonatronospira sp. TaxID=1962951 RepID=UPI0025BB5A51|nr:DegT/DnrJ/EryC1/StrS family aminotransferase [Desulfonatronospira sp.]